MGQYYRPTFVNNQGNPIATAYPLANGYGLKLMEHSYYNVFTLGMLNHLRKNPKSRIVWAGDYADDTCKCREKGKGWVSCNIYYKANDLEENGKIERIGASAANADYLNAWIVNHTKRIAIPYYPKEYAEKKAADPNYMPINVLALLTCEGNGRGGGDYHGTYMDLVGSWSRDLLSVAEDESQVPQRFAKDDIAFDEIWG